VAQSWEYDGVDLTTYAYNVRLLGAPVDVPARRGDNVVIPGKRGRLYTAKQHDQRLLTLAMWVRDIHPTTGSEAGSEVQMLSNLDTLRGLFARDGQHTLSHTMGGVTRYATAEVNNAVEFQPQGTNLSAFVVEFLLADPWWYAAAATTVGPTTITASPQNIGITNNGTYVAIPTLTVTGPIANPTFTIGSVWVKFNDSIVVGETLTIDCESWEADVDGVDASGDITHEGKVRWLEIPVGVSTLTVASSGYAGTTDVTVEFTQTYV